jgi:ABC-type cobalamin/Fe3+-siderophores transport system ATPase subunit
MPITLKSTAPFKSLPALEQVLPDFTIISGLNGAGKTHLLQGIGGTPGDSAANPIAILEGAARLEPIRLADQQSLAPNAVGAASRATVQQEIANLWTQYQQALSQRHPAQRVSGLQQLIKQSAPLRKILTASCKAIENLEQNDFEDHYPITSEADAHDVFAHNFAAIFMRYNVRWTDNKFKRYLVADGHSDVFPLTDEEFSKKYGELPWVFANDVMAAAGLGYKLSVPPPSTAVAMPFNLKLISDHSGIQIDFADLSSGEKILMSLGLALYNSAKGESTFPRVLLLDEPDAHLHPSMAKQLLHVIERVFVSEKRVKVIMTTHSPSTVALAPEECLFLMSKSEPRLSKASKDAALSLLTSGVPTLSVLYENRRQIFVEGNEDARLYEQLCARLRAAGALVPQVSLTFISSGIAGTGSCDAVRTVVNSLRKGGNKFVFGIVDWDLKNVAAGGVMVLGEGRRYTIENYIFDPLLLGAFLLRDKVCGVDELGCEYVDVLKPDAERRQAVIDCVVQQVGAHIAGGHDASTQQVAYFDGSSARVPQWYLRIQGHALEEAIKKAYPPLNAYNNKSGGLKAQVVDKVVDDIPGLIPMDIVDLFLSIQNSQLATWAT